MERQSMRTRIGVAAYNFGFLFRISEELSISESVGCELLISTREITTKGLFARAPLNRKHRRGNRTLEDQPYILSRNYKSSNIPRTLDINL